MTARILQALAILAAAFIGAWALLGWLSWRWMGER
jgi:hypothetical protein